MSSSSLWVMDKNFNGCEVANFYNSWLVTPVSWDILLNKYLPTFEERNFMSASMFDDKLFGKLNTKINNSDIQEDRVLWEMGNQQVFFTKDKEFIANSLKSFLTINSKLATKLGEHIHERFVEVVNEILNIDIEKYPYFIFKNTSCDDGVEYWFKKYDEEEGDYSDRSLRYLEKSVTEFVIIEKDKIVSFIGNLDYFKNFTEKEDEVIITHHIQLPPNPGEGE